MFDELTKYLKSARCDITDLGEVRFCRCPHRQHLRERHSDLRKYKNNDHFFFTAQQALENVCNAPKDKSGIFVVRQLKNSRIELVCIGSSGKIQNNEKINPKGGLYDSIVNEEQFGEIPRKNHENKN